MKNIVEIAKVVRSKNTGPFELTLDIIFKTNDYFNKVKDGQMINKNNIAGLYNISPEEVKKVIYFAPAGAVKIVLDRETPSGSPGDTDVYGAQQHAPLLKLNFDIN